MAVAQYKQMSEWGLESLGPRPPGLVAIVFITSIPSCGSMRDVAMVSGLSPRSTYVDAHDESL